MNRSRKRKSMTTGNDTSKTGPKLKRVKSEVSVKRLVGDARIVLDRSIVDKYFLAKKILHDILSREPRVAYRRSGKKSARNDERARRLDRLQASNDSISGDDSRVCQIKEEELELPADDVDPNDTGLAYDVNMVPQPRVVYYMDERANNCVLLDSSLVVLPGNAKYTPEEFAYNNYGYLPVIGLPLKTEPAEDDAPVEQELNGASAHRSPFAVCARAIGNAEGASAVATATANATIDETTIRHCYDDDETKSANVNFNNRGFPYCPKCGRNFKKRPALKKHKLLCGLKFFYECLYCTYKTPTSINIKSHVARFHKKEVEDRDLEMIIKEINKRRNDKKILSLTTNTSEVASDAEENFITNFDLLCPECEIVLSRKQINNEVSSKEMCPGCQVTLVFRCQTCGEIFLSSNQVHHHVITEHRKKNPKIYNCDHCRFETTHEIALRQHILHCQTKRDKPTYYECNVCSFQTFYKNSFNRHKRTVHRLNKTKDLDN
ncbi:uncharacterized protein LOC131669923 isoform X2 [Phymastichus coffea]|uniref:uncharacterized protein LOC131669923 isoform X2 n=1 Tax=Phymastichus coffea TaxID=108790 RepID=UPI00273BEFBF|nr:uncharacterized protein LOC131669923 isoform X2 [Phymastichus coffea]